MLNIDANADSVITIDNINSNSTTSENNDDSRRRQRDHDGGTHQDDDNSSSSSPSQRQPHHVMTQPVFLQLIFPFVPTKKFSTPLLFNSVSTSWSETIQHYSGAQLCWNALVRSGAVEKDDDKHYDDDDDCNKHDDDDDDDDARRSVNTNIADRFIKLFKHVLIRISFSSASAFDTILLLPRKIANLIVARMNTAFIEELYRRRISSVQVLEQLFSVIERFEGADALKNRLEQIRRDLEPVVAREHAIAAHYFDTLKRLGVNWKEFFARKEINWTSLLQIVCFSSSTLTLKMAIDICRGVGDDFLKSLLEPNYEMMHPSALSCCCEGESVAIDSLQILFDLLQELYGTTSEMFKRRVFTAEHFSFACRNNSVARSPIIKALLNACGVEQLCDTTHSTPLQVVTTHGGRSAENIRSVIGRCRELGGSEFVRRQLNLTGQDDNHAPFTYSFANFSFDRKKVQYFIRVMKEEFEMNFLKEQLWKTNGDGNTLLLAACRWTLSEEIEFVLNDVFKANNFTDEEILAHFQCRNHDGENVLMLAGKGYNDAKHAQINLIISELLRLQHQTSASSPLHQQRRVTSILKDMLEQESNNGCYHVHYTPLMYAVGCDAERQKQLDLVTSLVHCYRDECAATVDEMKHHLKGALGVAISKRSTLSTFQFLWHTCLSFNDDAFLKSALESTFQCKFSRKQLSVLACSVPYEYCSFGIHHEVLPYLVKFDLFDKQYKALDTRQKFWLKLQKIDEDTPLRMKQEEAKKIARELPTNGGVE